MNGPAIIDRLKAMVPDLRKVGLAADLDAVLKPGAQSQSGASAFVIMTGERGAAPRVAAGAFIQSTQETISILITVREISNSIGDKSATDLEVLKRAVRDAIVGWTPSGGFSPYALSQGTIVGFRPGFLSWAYEFTAADQIRIAT